MLWCIRIGEITNDIFSQLATSYEKNVTDEFLLPIINAETPDAAIKDGDAVICFNFRTDRAGKLPKCLPKLLFPIMK